mgnify:CR=1 FL=1
MHAQILPVNYSSISPACCQSLKSAASRRGCRLSRLAPQQGCHARSSSSTAWMATSPASRARPRRSDYHSETYRRPGLLYFSRGISSWLSVTRLKRRVQAPCGMGHAWVAKESLTRSDSATGRQTEHLGSALRASVLHIRPGALAACSGFYPVCKAVKGDSLRSLTQG